MPFESDIIEFFPMIWTVMDTNLLFFV